MEYDLGRKPTPIDSEIIEDEVFYPSFNIYDVNNMDLPVGEPIKVVFSLEVLKKTERKEGGYDYEIELHKIKPIMPKAMIDPFDQTMREVIEAKMEDE